MFEILLGGCANPTQLQGTLWSCYSFVFTVDLIHRIWREAHGWVHYKRKLWLNVFKLLALMNGICKTFTKTIKKLDSAMSSVAFAFLLTPRN